MSERASNDYSIIGASSTPRPAIPTTPRPIIPRRRAPAPPPRRSSIPAVLERESTFFPLNFKETPLPEESLLTQDSDTEDSSDEDNSYTLPIPDSAPSKRVAMAARRVPSFSPTPKPRSKTLSRSKSLDNVADGGGDGGGGAMKENSSFMAPGCITMGKPVMVAPPTKPGERRESVMSTSTDATPPHSMELTSEPTRGSAYSSTYVTLGSLSGPSISKAFPLRIEMMEGYMSNHISHITFSASDMFNVHLIKQQEVVRVKDCNGHVYSIPLYSTLQIGLIQDSLVSTAKTSGTLPKMAKVSDVMQLKELPKLMSPLKSVKSGIGEVSSIEEREILLVLGISRGGPKKKKKGLEVYSITKSRKKFLYQDCAGHFSLSTLLISLPIATFFKHVENVETMMPFKARLFFKSDYTTSMCCSDTESTIPPPSLTDSDVMVMKKVLETSVIASPFFEDSPVDVTNSENLLHIPLDRYLSRVEITLVEITDPTERNKLYNDTCVVHEKINLSQVKYYHDSDSQLVHHTQTYLYAKCRSAGRTGIKMELPVWKPSSDKALTELREEQELQEAYQTIPEVIDIGSSENLSQTPGSYLNSSSTRRTANSPSHTSLTSSISSVSVTSQSELTKSNQFGGDDSVFMDERPPMPTPHPPIQNFKTRELPATPKSKKQLKATYSVGDVQSRLPMAPPPTQERPLHHIPPPVPPQDTKRSLHSHSTAPNLSTRAQTEQHTYQSPRQALLTSIETSSPKDLLSPKPMEDADTSATNITPTRQLKLGDLPPRDLQRTPGRTSRRETHHGQQSASGSNMDREGFKRSLDSPVGMPRMAGDQSNMTPSRNIHSPLPELPKPKVSDIYQVPRSAGDSPLASSSSSSIHLQSKSVSRSPSSVSSNQQYRAAPPPPATAPHGPPPADEDDSDLYEEMNPVSTRTGMAPHRAVGGVTSRGQHSVQKTSLGGRSSPGGADLHNKSRDSGGYEIFDPPVSSKTVKEVKAEVSSLTKQLQKLTEQFEKLESREAELQTSLAAALKRIEILEGAGAQRPSDQGSRRPSKERTMCQSNRDYLKTLSCDQIQLVLEGMGLRQYIPVVRSEGLDGEMFLHLDDNVLSQELKVNSRIHRMKLMKLINGEYRASSYYGEQATSV